MSWGRSLVSTCGCRATFGLKEGSRRQISAQNKQWLELEPTGKWSVLSYEVGIPGHLMCPTVYWGCYKWIWAQILETSYLTPLSASQGLFYLMKLWTMASSTHHSVKLVFYICSIWINIFTFMPPQCIKQPLSDT